MSFQGVASIWLLKSDRNPISEIFELFLSTVVRVMMTLWIWNHTKVFQSHQLWLGKHFVRILQKSYFCSPFAWFLETEVNSGKLIKNLGFWWKNSLYWLIWDRCCTSSTWYFCPLRRSPFSRDRLCRRFWSRRKLRYLFQLLFGEQFWIESGRTMSHYPVAESDEESVAFGAVVPYGGVAGPYGAWF